jgi:hypothetical protein
MSAFCEERWGRRTRSPGADRAVRARRPGPTRTDGWRAWRYDHNPACAAPSGTVQRAVSPLPASLRLRYPRTAHTPAEVRSGTSAGSDRETAAEPAPVAAHSCPLFGPPAPSNPAVEPKHSGIIIRVSGVRVPPPASRFRANSALQSRYTRICSEAFRPQRTPTNASGRALMSLHIAPGGDQFRPRTI